jgi:hypothetical protein
MIAIIAFRQGNPKLLAAPIDPDGKICGYSPGYEHYPYIFYKNTNVTDILFK